MSNYRAIAWIAIMLSSSVAFSESTPSVNESAKAYFTDIELVDQNGETQRFYADLMQGKQVIINAFFTSCEGVCPVLTKKMTEVQEFLGDRLGDTVNMLSISVDPETDSVERLADYARLWKARPGWYFLSGDPDKVRAALTKLGQYVEEPDAHSAVVLVGNEPTGLWKKANGLSPTDQLISIVTSVLEDRE